jgi:hypothetical protein
LHYSGFYLSAMQQMDFPFGLGHLICCVSMDGAIPVEVLRSE